MRVRDWLGHQKEEQSPAGTDSTTALDCRTSHLTIHRGGPLRISVGSFFFPNICLNEAR